MPSDEKRSVNISGPGELKKKGDQNRYAFDFKHGYISDVLSMNKPNFSDWVILRYPPELNVEETSKQLILPYF